MAPRNIPTKLSHTLLEQSCPCGSLQQLRFCCFSPLDGQIRPPLARLAPPPPITGFSHSRCYMSSTSDCGPRITKEHYVSHAVLGAMGDQIICSGLPWLSDGKTARFGKNSLTANVLCDRHNNALSPLDAAAAIFFSELRHVADQLGRKAWSKKIRLRAIRGENLELWALKILMGIFHAGIARSEGRRLRDGFQLPFELYCGLLASQEKLVSPAGMYVQASSNHRYQLENAVAMAPLTSRPGNEAVGLWMKIAGHDIKFLFRLDEVGSENLIKSAHVYRPSDLVFVSEAAVDERLFLLKLGWASAKPAMIVMAQELRTPQN